MAIGGNTTTPSRAASSSGARLSSGCAMDWASSNHPPTSNRSPYRPDTGGVYLVPAFAGLGAPTGINTPAEPSPASPAAPPPLISRGPHSRHRVPGRGHPEAMKKMRNRNQGTACRRRCCANNLLMQFQADISGTRRPPKSHRNNCARRRLPRGTRRRILGLDRRTRPPLARRQTLRAVNTSVSGGGAPRGVARGVEPVEELDRRGVSSMRRADMLVRLEEHQGPWDMVIIGGGATGVGMAVDAAAAATRAASRAARFRQGHVEPQHQAGPRRRALSQQGNIALVMEALKERGLLRQNAPHLVSIWPSWCRTTLVGSAVLRAWTQGLRRARRQIRFRQVGNLAQGELDRLPTTKTEGLRGGVVYYDGQFDNARLLIDSWRPLQTTARRWSTTRASSR